MKLALPRIAAAGLVAMALALPWAIDSVGITPRTLAPYLERRSTGHNPAIEAAGKWLGNSLRTLERGQPLDVWPDAALPPAPEQARAGTIVLVGSVEKARKALENAHPGDIITFAPGTYRFKGGNGYLPANQAGLPGKEVTVRAERAGTVQLEFDLVEGFKVTAPYWTFENLDIHGICTDHSTCEHAFHVVGDASHFVARNNTIVDFNAHFKINGSGNAMPDHGLLDGNILTNSGVRNTANPVTPIDMVAASSWMIRGNRISDFVKADGDLISYGAYAKGAGEGNRFVQNLVVCENRLRGEPGQRIGLSLGGGGSGKEHCRDRQCVAEQFGGVIQSNLIVSCSDDGIYVNRGANSTISHNTLIDTGPIVVRFAESSADVEGNLVDSAIQTRDGGSVRQVDNRQTSVWNLYLGWHPVRRLFANTAAFDFRWQDGAPQRTSEAPPPPDLCGGPRPFRPTYGASEDYSRCLAAGR